VEKTTVAQLQQGEQAELESVLKAYRQGRAGDPELKQRFYSTYDEVAIFWAVLFVGGIAGAVALSQNYFSPYLGFSVGELLRMELSSFWASRDMMGRVACLIIAVWMGFLLVRNFKRRGSVATSFAVVKIRARKVSLVRHPDVTAITWSRQGSRGKTFSILYLTDKDGRRLSLYGSHRWVEVALGLLTQARDAAGLPPVQVTDEWGPFYRRIPTQA
jgi:hypothetical protein